MKRRVLNSFERIFYFIQIFVGGIWINLGPLLYHFSNMMDQNSIEPSYEMIRDIIKGFGFIYEVRTIHVRLKFPFIFYFYFVHLFAH